MEAGGLDVLFDCSSNSNPDLQAQCAGAIAALAEETRNQVQMARMERRGLASLLSLSQSSSITTREDVTRAYASLSSNPENQMDVFLPTDYGAIFSLCSTKEKYLKREEEGGAREEAERLNERCGTDGSIAIGNLAVISKNQLQLVKHGALEALAFPLRSTFASCQLYAARALYRLAAQIDNHDAILKAKALQPLVVLLGNKASGSKA